MVVVLTVLFFLSGASALVYEISWSRQIGLLFGHSVQAAAVVLSCYFAGLSLGYGLGARWTRDIRPLTGYAVCEFVVAAWACLVPLLLSWGELPAAARFLEHPVPLVQTLTRTAFCFALLLPATTALGATLPFMAGFLSSTSRAGVHRVNLAYAVNTAGAVAGVLLCASPVLVIVGVRGMSSAAAAVSAACGVVALLVSFGRRAESIDRTGTTAATPDRRRAAAGARILTGIVLLSGFGTLALEVLYIRLFALIFHNSTYTFAVVVAVFLLGLSLGARLVNPLSRVVRLDVLATTACLLGGVGAALSVPLFVHFSGLKYLRFGDSFFSYLAGSFGMVAATMMAPVTLLGLLLPTVWTALAQRAQEMGALVGRLAMMNSAAAAAGSLLTSLVFLPTLGLFMSFALISLLFITAAVFIGCGRRTLLRTTLRIGVGLAGVAPLFALEILQNWQMHPPQGTLVRRWQSSYGWIDVVRTEPEGELEIRQDLHYRLGAAGRNAPREYRQAHLPLLLHADPEQVLFLGLGTGITAAGAIQHGAVRHADVVELIPEVVDAAKLFSADNFSMASHPKFNVRIDDARHYLQATRRSYDVIVSDLFVPWESETGYLYTVETYRAARERLNPEGLFCQWLALYQLGPQDFQIIADTIASVFPNVTLWWGHLDPARPIVALLGTDEPLTVDTASVNQRLRQLVQKTEMANSLMKSGTNVFELYIGDWTGTCSPLLNTDEHPWIEFQSPISHCDGNLLAGIPLRQFFDNALANLPRENVHLKRGTGNPPPLPPTWQRTVLFPDLE